MPKDADLAEEPTNEPGELDLRYLSTGEAASGRERRSIAAEDSQ